MKSINKKKIAVFLPSFYPLPMGGAEIQILRLAKYMQQDGIDIFFVTPHQTGLKSFELINEIPVYRFKTMVSILKRRKKQKGFRFKNQEKPIWDYSDKKGNELIYAKSSITFAHIIFMIDMFLSVFFFLSKRYHRFDILQINNVTFYAVIITLVGKLLNKKIVIKDSTMDGILQMRQTLFPSLGRYFICHNATFIAMTHYIYENMIKAGIPKRNIYSIPNGIEVFNYNRKYHAFGYRCLFVGNLYQQPAKGIDILLKAWPIVLEKYPAATLSIVGEGNISAYRDYIIELGLEGSITLCGKCDPDIYYQTHDLFILPSRREGMSNALMEAMMYKMPVVATNISGNQDLIKSRSGGILVEPNSVKALSEGIITCLSLHYKFEKWGEYNYHRIRELCNLETIVQKYICLYNVI